MDCNFFHWENFEETWISDTIMIVQFWTLLIENYLQTIQLRIILLLKKLSVYDSFPVPSNTLNGLCSESFTLVYFAVIYLVLFIIFFTLGISSVLKMYILAGKVWQTVMNRMEIQFIKFFSFKLWCA